MFDKQFLDNVTSRISAPTIYIKLLLGYILYLYLSSF